MMRQMIADYMETGFLDNITEMFRQDPSLFEHLPFLMSDIRGRVRLGTVALVESLLSEFRTEIRTTIPALRTSLGHDHPTVRADTVYLLGVIGEQEAIPFLQNYRNDPAPQVRQVITETIEELKAIGRQEIRQ